MTEVGIVGLPQSGKSTLMCALTGIHTPLAGAPGEAHHGILMVPDDRVDRLSEMYKPKKTTYATIQFTDLVGAHGPLKKGELFTPAQVGHLRDMDLLVLVIRFFSSDAIPHPLSRINPAEDLNLFLGECLLADLMVAEKRIERIEHDLRKGSIGKKKDELEAEKGGLLAIKEALESEMPVAGVELSPQQQVMYKGFGFLSGKKIIPVANTGDLNHPEEKKSFAALREEAASWNARCPAWDLPEPLLVNARLELELREMVGADQIDSEEALQYFEEVGLAGSSRTQIIQQAYSSLGLISFLTAGEDEVRAWTIPKGTHAPAAAGVIHSDLERGFIRAETVSYEDFVSAGDLAECRKHGTLRQEGKDYAVRDGDILNIRFSV
jgi:GTP-binding protein YchF